MSVMTMNYNAYAALAVVFEYDKLRVVKREYLKAADWLDLQKEWLKKVEGAVHNQIRTLNTQNSKELIARTTKYSSGRWEDFPSQQIS